MFTQLTKTKPSPSSQTLLLTWLAYVGSSTFALTGDTKKITSIMIVPVYVELVFLVRTDTLNLVRVLLGPKVCGKALLGYLDPADGFLDFLCLFSFLTGIIYQGSHTNREKHMKDQFGVKFQEISTCLCKDLTAHT